jgi:hypothetical protein
MTNIGKPYEGKPHVRFDEEGLVLNPALYSSFALLDNSELVCVNGRSFEYYKCSWFWYYATYIAITGGTIEHLLQKQGYPIAFMATGYPCFFLHIINSDHQNLSDVLLCKQAFLIWLDDLIDQVLLLLHLILYSTLGDQRKYVYYIFLSDPTNTITLYGIMETF